MANPQRVLIIGDASLFTTGLTAWLACDTSCQVSSACIDDVSALSHEIDRIRPGTIIVCGMLPTDLTNLLDQPTTSHEPTVARIIVAHPDSNTLDIYEKQQVEIKRGADFIALMQGTAALASA